MRSRARGAAAVATCAATAVTMHAFGTALATPPIHSWSRTEAWYEQLGPSMAVMAVLRLLALAVAAWLAAAIALQLLASLRFGWALRRIADSVSPGWVRRMGHGMAGLTLSAALTIPIAAPPTSLAISVVADNEPGPEGPVDGDGIAVMRLEPQGAPAPSTTTTSDSTMPTTGAPVAASEPPPAPPGTHRVEMGQSCWVIAANLLEDTRGAPQPERAIREVWIRLIELNRDRFVTGDPDVIYPGQVLLLPDVER